MSTAFLFDPWFLLASGLAVLAVIGKIAGRHAMRRRDRHE